MARRYIGNAIVTIQCADRSADGERSVYEGYVTVPHGEVTVGRGGTMLRRAVRWHFDDLRSAAGGVRTEAGYLVASDSSIAYDLMAASAVNFGSSFSAEHPDDPSEAVACVIEEAIQPAARMEGGYEIRRKP